MTITNTDRTVTATGNGATTEWPFTFKIPDAASANVVTTVVATGVQSVIDSADYTISGLDDDNGGEVVYPTVASGDPALTSATSITIYRSVPQTQEVAVSNQTRYDAGVVSGVWDRLTMMIQDLSGDSLLALSYPQGDTENNVLPSATLRADKLIAFDSNGAVVVVTLASLGGVVISDIVALINGTASAGTSTEVSRVDHVHPDGLGTVYQAYDADTSKTDVAETRSASINMADNELIRPKLKDTSNTVNNIGSVGGGTQDIDLELGGVVKATIDTSTTTFTFSHPAATGIDCGFWLKLTNGGSQTIVWPAAVTGLGSVTFTTAGEDWVYFGTDDAGASWPAVVIALDVKA